MEAGHRAGFFASTLFRTIVLFTIYINVMPSETALLHSANPLADAALRLDQQLCFALYSASLAMTKLYRPLLDELELTYPQYLVMLTLWERDGASVGEIGAQLTLDSGTLTPLLKRLETAGWLQRQRSEGDERRVEVHLTDAGRALKEQARSLPPRIAAATGCTLDELRSLTQRLQGLRSSLSHSVPPT